MTPNSTPPSGTQTLRDQLANRFLGSWDAHHLGASGPELSAMSMRAYRMADAMIREAGLDPEQAAATDLVDSLLEGSRDRYSAPTYAPGWDATKDRQRTRLVAGPGLASARPIAELKKKSKRGA